MIAEPVSLSVALFLDLAKAWEDDAHGLTVNALECFDEGRHDAAGRLSSRASGLRQAAIGLRDLLGEL